MHLYHIYDKYNDLKGKVMANNRKAAFRKFFDERRNIYSIYDICCGKFICSAGAVNNTFNNGQGGFEFLKCEKVY